MAEKYFGAVELGGTKTIALIAKDHKTILARKRFPTLSPGETIAQIKSFFLENPVTGSQLAAVGVGSFGPLDLNPDSDTFGFVTTTPKAGWQFYDLKSEIESGLQCAVSLDTDVNAAALGEYRFRDNPVLNNLAYITIGTGIGGGFIVNGNLIHGLLHPEFGHLYIPHDTQVDPFTGICPYHQDCFEGLASGPALNARWGQLPELLPPDHTGWDLESEYISLALVNLVCTLSPEVIILGGGVMHQTQLYQKVRLKLQRRINKYIQSRSLDDHLDQYIIPPKLGENSGILGALSLAMDS